MCNSTINAFLNGSFQGSDFTLLIFQKPKAGPYNFTDITVASS